jgi:hypothetical protein
MVRKRVRAIRFAEPASWWFELDDGGTIRTETFWRIVAAGRMKRLPPITANDSVYKNRWTQRFWRVAC